jgi:hypothetical protein
MRVFSIRNFLEKLYCLESVVTFEVFFWLEEKISPTFFDEKDLYRRTIR